MATERGYTGGELQVEGPPPADAPLLRWPAVAAAATTEHARAATLALAGFVALSVLVRSVLAWSIPTPWIMLDEFLYSELAKSFADRAELLIREQPYPRLSLVYPVAVSPAWLSDTMATTYGVAKVVNGVLMSLAAVPMYLWGRRLVSPALALVAAGLVLLLPGLAYSGTIMTENAFFPAFVFATYAMARALEQPTLLNQGLVVAAAALATGVRVQGVVLFAVALVAILAKVALDLRVRAGRPWELLRPYVPLLATLIGGSIAYVLVKRAQGADVFSGLGSYAGVNTTYDYGAAARWIVRHAAELDLVVGVAPVAALLVLAVLAVVRGLPSPAERAFVAVALPALALVVVQVGTYASRFSLRVQERNMFHVAPLLLLALVVWLDRGAPRPRWVAPGAAIAASTLLLALPLGLLLNVSITSDTFALIPLQRLDAHVGDPRAYMLVGGFVAALAFLLVPRGLASIVLPAALAAYFVVSASAVARSTEDYSRNLRTLLPAEASWVDGEIGPGSDAPYLFGSNPDPFNEAVGLWQLEFWNRSVGAIYNTGIPGASNAAEYPASIDRATGRIMAADPGLARARYVVAPQTLDLAERPLQAGGRNILYAVEQPLQVETSTGGVYADGWMGADAAYDRYTGRPGTLTIDVSRAGWGGPDKPGLVVVEVGPLATQPDGAPTIAAVAERRTWTIHSGLRRTFQLETPKPPFRASVHVEPTFSPAEYGLGDTRALGAQVAFGFVADR